MATQRTIAPKKPARRFADGGNISEAQRLIAEMNAKYGLASNVPAPQQQAAQPAPRPAPQPEQKPAGGLLDSARNIFGNRAKQIDKAAGYAEGGIIRGPGTAKSDSIPATVRETGEEIRVSTGERVVSAEQGKFLETVAKNAGYGSLDAMLEDGTGKPVGPTIKAGKRAAADGLAPELDPFAYRGKKPEYPQRVAAAIAAPPTLGAAPLARTEPAGGALSGPASGITALGPKPAPVGSGLTINPGKPNPDMGFIAGPAPGIAPDPVTKPGRNAAGIITDDTAKSALGADMQRSGGIFGNYDGKGVNDILARENKARGEMIDLMIKAQGGNGIAVLPDRTNEDNERLQAMKLSPQEYLAYMQAKGRQEAFVNEADARNGIAMRGQELHAKTEAARLAGNPFTNALNAERIAGQQLSNEKAKRLGDLQQQLGGESDPAKRAVIAGQIRELTGRTDKASQGETLTLPQVRANFEIDAARERIAGLSPEEIKQKTQQFSATGRENGSFDPTLAKAVSLANRRKYGADDHFDQGQQAQQSAGSDGDVMTRFRADQAMQGHKLGKTTEQGTEVFDSTGRLIGHYR